MKDISTLIARKEYLPATEDIQQELVELFGERRVEQDSLIQNFASGMISGAIAAPSIISTVNGRARNVQVLNESSRLLVRHRHKPRSDDPGFFTYMIGTLITAIGVSLIGTPVAGISPVLIGVGTGLLGTGVSIAGEAKAKESRNRNNRE